MTREAAKKVLIDLGIEEPTDQQISNYLNTVNGEVQKEKDKTKDVIEKAGLADELQKKLDEIEANNLTEMEKAIKRAEEAEKALASEKKDKLVLKITSVFASNGMSGDMYAGAIKAFSALSEEEAIEAATSFVSEIAENNKTALETAKANWEAERLANTPNPSGGNGASGKAEDKSYAAEYAKQYTSKMNPTNTQGETDSAPVNF